MRHWNLPALFWAGAKVFGFLLYLWGIETQSFLSYSFFFSLCFYSTYEALKHKTGLNMPFLTYSFLLYLWGIETPIPEKIEWIDEEVFTLPMRHWNINTLKDTAWKPYRFYSTYEALKRYRNIQRCFCWQCFYSTYEALKPSPSQLVISEKSQFLLYLWGIETWG